MTISALTLSGNLNYTPPGGDSAINAPLSVTGTYAAQSAGTIDVPSGTASGTTYGVAFGSIASPVGVMIKNRVGTGVNVTFNSANQSLRLNQLGVITIVMAEAAATNPLSAIDVDLVQPQTAPGEIEFLVFGA